MTTKHALLTLLGAGLLSALSSCTSPVSPAGTGLPGVTNYYTNYSTNRNTAMVRLQIRHNTVAPIRFRLADTQPFSTSGFYYFEYFYTSTNENSNTQYFSVVPGNFYLSLYFPNEPLATTYGAIYHGVYQGIGWYGSGMVPFDITGGARYTFVVTIKTTSTATIYSGYSNMLNSYLTRPVNLAALNTQVDLIKEDGY
ncbi:MAG: hypothetical protein J0L75_09010 [Spirochaetes bacterium]|nr:hypothetical protein [Spirochaetota bacterium]